MNNIIISLFKIDRNNSNVNEDLQIVSEGIKKGGCK